ncbi:Pentatricopeptide repeat-containing protein At5g02860 [Coccomyxa sp. Obi]|nr:Pentatricopeptide repeat-containing protein At5g02860 [Coccomyxa sp. Obi]
MPIMDRGPAAERVYWRGSVMSREAVLGRMLVCLPAGHSVADVLDGEMLCSKQITRLLSWLGHEGRLDLALAAFDWLDSRPEYFTADRFLYTRLMSISARQPHGAPQALALFDRMCAARIRPDVVAFNAAIGAAGKAGSWERVIRLYEDMQQLGVTPDVWTFSALMAACQACGNRWKSALDFLEQMEDAGIKGNVVLYTTLMSVCRRGGQPEIAVRIFRTMESDGLQLDVVAYNQAMASCSWEQAWACFNAMRRAGVQPNTRSYNALIAACERDGEADRALEAFARMEREATKTYGYVEPSAVTYNTLISACGKAGKYEEALEIAAAMRSAGHAPDSFTVCSLVAAAGTAGRWRSALATFRDFCAAGGRPNTATYNALIRALGQGGQPARALAVFDGMRSGQPPAPDQAPAPPPDARTWAAAIAACRANGRWRDVLRLYHDMCDSEFVLDGYVLQTVISACERAGAWEEADAVFQRMEAAGQLADMDGLALATRRVLYALPALVAGPLMTTAHLAVDSGRAARRWIARPPA